MPSSAALSVARAFRSDAAVLFGLGLAESLLLSVTYKNLRALSLNVISAPLLWGGLLFLTGLGSLRRPLRFRGELAAMAAALGVVWTLFARPALRPEFVVVLVEGGVQHRIRIRVQPGENLLERPGHPGRGVQQPGSVGVLTDGQQ